MFEKIFDLTGKTAIVTGGRRGLGQMMAKALNDFGANIAIVARTEDFDETMGMLNKNSMAFTADISKDEDVKKMVSKVEDQFGAVDIIVNNAAIAGHQDTFEIPAEEFLEIFEVNVLGMFLCCRAVFPGMKKRGHGKIINIASAYGSVGADSSLYLDKDRKRFEVHAYTGSKGAVVNMTRDLAAAWGKYNINVNVLSPGMMLTKRQKKIFSKEAVNKISQRVPMKRMGAPEDLAGGVVFLSSGASNYVNGCNLVVDGGWISW
jgi:gluconate 5-dehydrogenase